MNYSHFTIHELAEGVFAAIHQEGGAAYSNAGIIDLGGETLIFDTFDMAVAARELMRASLELTGRHPKWVVNSHKHGDHWGGNQVFAGEAVILATHQTRFGMMGWGAELEKQKTNRSDIEKQIRETEARLGKENDPLQRAAIERSLIRNRYELVDLPDFRFCPPTVTFSGRMVFHGGKRSVELVTTGPAHTPEECYLLLKREKIIFTGDLAFFNSPPFMAPDCSLDGWLIQLEEFKNSKIRHFVPGHGNPGEKSNLQRQQDYMREMRDMVAEAIQKKMPLKEVVKMVPPREFQDWDGFIQRNDNNLRTLYLQLSEKSKSGA